jgi:hypothetical protein
LCDVSLQEIAGITADDAASFSKYQMLWLLQNHAGSDALRADVLCVMEMDFTSVGLHGARVSPCWMFQN